MKTLMLLPLLFVSAAFPAQALTITVEDVYARINLDGSAGSAMNEASSPPVAVATASVGSDFLTDAMDGTASQSVGGVSSIDVGATDGFGSSGSPTKNVAKGVTQIDYKFFNDGPATISPVFDFNIKGVTLETFNAGSLTAPVASVDFSVIGATSFSADAKLTGIYDSDDADPEASGSIGGTLTQTDCSSGTCYGATFTGNAISGSVNVGPIAPGAFAYVIVIMGASAEFFGYELGARAKIEDPNGGPAFTWSVRTPTTQPPAPAPIPLPAGVVLLGTALGALGLGRIRRRA